MDKNLKLRYAERLFVPDENTNKNNANSISKSMFKDVRHVCVEPVNPSLYLATQNEIVQLDPRKREKTQMDWADKLNGHEVIMFEYLYDDATTFTLLSNGTAIVNNFMKMMNSYEMDTVEIINEEVTGGSWSPDTHILVVTTREKVYFVSREFDIINEGPLNPTTAGQSELMSVGWGSRETQFQGPSGRKKLDEVTAVKFSLLLLLLLSFFHYL
ncbi:unnamed protein product [Anisakis simplex]|uniref:Peptidase_S9_N domain-containing protein n=1 Tax=Anisakis simplex TaxID=6269 RepID=A0A0M3K0X0_ANISI|nr:unnamed protein product [Anisakis simplex]